MNQRKTHPTMVACLLLAAVGLLLARGQSESPAPPAPKNVPPDPEEATAPKGSVRITALDGTTTLLRSPRFDGWTLQGQKNGQPRTFDLREVVALRLLPEVADNPTRLPRGPRLVFPTGEVLQAEPQHTEDDFLVALGDEVGQVRVPLATLRGFVLAENIPAARIRETVARLRRTERKSDQLLLQNGDVLAGTFTELSNRKISLDRQGQTTTLERGLVEAVALDPNLVDYNAGSEFYVQLRLRDGSILNARGLRTREDGLLVVEAAFGGQLVLEPETLLALATRNGKVVYLSDLTPLRQEVRPYLDFTLPPQRDHNVQGQPLRLGGRGYDKGWGVASGTQLTFATAGFATFEATAGLDEEAGPQASARVRVTSGERVLFESETLAGGSPPLTIRLPLVDVGELTLTVEYGDRADVRDWFDWADARLLR